MSRITNQQVCFETDIYTIRTYYPEIGIIPPECDASRPGLHIPEPYESDAFELPLSKLLVSSAELKEIFNKKFGLCQATIDWHYSAQNLGKLKIDCQLKYNTENFNKLIQNWTKTIENTLADIRKEFSCEKFQISEDLWQKSCSHIEDEIQADIKEYCGKVSVIYDEQNFFVWVVGLQKETGMLTAKVRKVLNYIVEQDDIKTNTKIERLQTLKSHQIKLLVLTSFIKQMENQFNVKIDTGESYENLSITGLSKPTQDARIKIMETVPLFVQRSFPCSKQMLLLIAKDEQTQERLEEYMKTPDGDCAIATWEIRDDCVIVHAMDDNNGRLAFRIITENIASQTVAINELPIRKVLRNENWAELRKVIYLDDSHSTSLQYSNEYKSLIINGLQSKVLLDIKLNEQEEYESITYHGIKTLAIAAAELVREYLESKAIFPHFVSLPYGIAKYLQLYGIKILTDITKKFENFHLHLQPVIDDDAVGVEATGGKQAIEQSELMLKTLTKKLCTDYFRSHDAKKVKFLLSDAGQLLIKNLEEQIKVVIEKYNPNFEADEEKRNIACHVQKRENLEIAAILYDIASLKVDAIVNAANGRLKLGSGVAGAIKNRGINFSRQITKVCLPRKLFCILLVI